MSCGSYRTKNPLKGKKSIISIETKQIGARHMVLYLGCQLFSKYVTSSDVAKTFIQNVAYFFAINLLKSTYT